MLNALTMVCPIVAEIPQTINSFLWGVIYSTWPQNLALIPVFIAWVIFERVNRYGTFIYRSKKGNGYTPLFNMFIGSALFFALEEVIHFVLSFLFGNIVYCVLLVASTVALSYFLVDYILREVLGFWVYKKSSTPKKPWYPRRKGYRKYRKPW